ncbi:MAG: hypothetical protein IJQ16_08365 [Selenomonadaceae bacterium]|nr:hypothetical protein [Selenomonadaceae bacterium]
MAQIFGKNITLSLNFEGNFSNVNLAEFAGVPRLRSFQAIKNEDRLSIFITLPDRIEDAAEVATIMKNFIMDTYPVIKKNFLEENK